MIIIITIQQLEFYSIAFKIGVENVAFPLPVERSCPRDGSGRIVSELAADNCCVVVIPLIIAHVSPLVAIEDLDAALVRVPIADQTNVPSRFCINLICYVYM